MSMIFHMVWDTSGSMTELEKSLNARHAARTVEQYLRFGYSAADLKLVAWSDEARVLNWNPEHEFPPEVLVSKGPVSARALISLFETEPVQKVLILTDGFWAPEDAKELKRWKESHQPETLRVIKIGADANPRLKGKDVFAAEDLFAALDGWLEGDSA